MIKYLSIITLNVNGLNVPIKTHRVAEWIKKQDPHIYCLQETHLRIKDLYRGKVKGWEKKSPSKWTGKKKSQGCSTYIRQNRLQNKGHKKRQRRTRHNTQGTNPPRRRKYCEHTHTTYIRKSCRTSRKR